MVAGDGRVADQFQESVKAFRAIRRDRIGHHPAGLTLVKPGGCDEVGQCRRRPQHAQDSRRVDNRCLRGPAQGPGLEHLSQRLHGRIPRRQDLLHQRRLGPFAGRDHLADQAPRIWRSLLPQVGLGRNFWLARRALLDRSLRFHGRVFLPDSDHATTAEFYRGGKGASSLR